MAVDVRYHFFTLPEREQQVRDMAESLRWMLPRWLRVLSFEMYEDKPDGSSMSANFAPEYGTANIEIYEQWFGESAATRRRMMVHEIIHLHHAHVLDFAKRELLDPLRDDISERLHGVLSREWTRRIEAFTQDLAFTLEEREGE